MRKEPRDRSIEEADDDQTDPVAREVVESLPAYREWERDRYPDRINSDDY